MPVNSAARCEPRYTNASTYMQLAIPKIFASPVTDVCIEKRVLSSPVVRKSLQEARSLSDAWLLSHAHSIHTWQTPSFGQEVVAGDEIEAGLRTFVVLPHLQVIDHRDLP